MGESLSRVLLRIFTTEKACKAGRPLGAGEVGKVVGKDVGEVLEKGVCVKVVWWA